MKITLMWNRPISTSPSKKLLNPEFKRQHLLKDKTQIDSLSTDSFQELLTKVIPNLTKAILTINDLI